MLRFRKKLVLLLMLASTKLVVTVANTTSDSDAKLRAENKQMAEAYFKGLAKTHLGRVFGETPATPGQFPWMAFLVSDYGDVSSGSLISDQWILTSAYYCSMYNLSSIILGIVDYTCVTDYSENPKITNKYNYTCYMHELYGLYNATNDHNIALIKMLQPVTFTVNIMPIKLPSVNDATKDFTNVSMTVSGFMLRSSCYEYGNNRQSDKFSLKYEELHGVSYTECSADLSALYGITLLESAICTGNTNVGPCSRVQGAPLFYKNQNGYWVISGIIAFRPGRYCYNDGPTVFTRVSSNLDWISSITGMALPGESTSTPKATTGKPSTTTIATKPTSRSTGKTTTTTKPLSTKTPTKTTKTTTKASTKTTTKTATTKKTISTTKAASG